LVYVVAVT